MQKLYAFSTWLDYALDKVIWQAILIWNAIGGAYMFWVLISSL